MVGHVGDDFESEGVFYGFGTRWTPCKWAVIAHENGGDFQGIESLEAFDDDISSFPFVGVGNLGGREGAGYGHLAAKVVGMGGAEQRDATRRLGEGDRLARVRVHDRADARKAEKKPAMCRSVGRGIESPLDHPAVKINDDHVLGFQGRVGNTTGFDGKNSSLAVTNAHITEGQIDKT